MMVGIAPWQIGCEQYGHIYGHSVRSIQLGLKLCEKLNKTNKITLENIISFYQTNQLFLFISFNYSQTSDFLRATLLFTLLLHFVTLPCLGFIAAQYLIGFYQVQFAMTLFKHVSCWQSPCGSHQGLFHTGWVQHPLTIQDSTTNTT